MQCNSGRRSIIQCSVRTVPLNVRQWAVWQFNSLRQCSALCRSALHCIEVHCTVQKCTALYRSALHCTAHNCTAHHKAALHCTELHYTVHKCTVEEFSSLFDNKALYSFVLQTLWREGGWVLGPKQALVSWPLYRGSQSSQMPSRFTDLTTALLPGIDRLYTLIGTEEKTLRTQAKSPRSRRFLGTKNLENTFKFDNVLGSRKLDYFGPLEKWNYVEFMADRETVLGGRQKQYGNYLSHLLPLWSTPIVPLFRVN